MDFVTFLKSQVIAFFKSFAKPNTDAVAAVVERWGMDLGFDRTGNTTDHRSQLDALRGQATSRVSLDKYVDGTQGIVVNRMQAVDAGQVFLSAIHGAILAWRRDSGAKTADGKERLIDEQFTSCAQYVGLMKIADKKPVYKDGVAILNPDGTPKMANVGDTTRRVWYGANASLEKVVEAFVKAAPALPTGYIGTDAKNVIGTILLPCAVNTRSGAKKAGVYVRISSYTAAEAKVQKGDSKSNIALDTFEQYIADADFDFDLKNKGYKTLFALSQTRKAALEAATVLTAEPEPEIPVKAPTRQKRAA
jgi:hypothetical protein